MQVASSIRSISLFAALLCTSLLVGCGGGTAQFSQNKVSTRVQEIAGGVEDGMSRNLYQQVTDIMTAVFGTPDEPTLVAGGTEQDFIDMDNLVMCVRPSLCRTSIG